MENNSKISYKNYKNLYKNFATTYCIEGSLSVDTIKTVVYYMNSDSLDENVTKKIFDLDFITPKEIKVDYVSNAIEEIKNYNIDSYFKGKEPIKLSDAIILESQKEDASNIEKLLSRISELPQEEAIKSYNELKSIIKFDECKNLTMKQKHLVYSISIPVANNLLDYRDNAKQFRKVS